MAKLFLNLRNVPDDEADEVRALEQLRNVLGGARDAPAAKPGSGRDQ